MESSTLDKGIKMAPFMEMEFLLQTQRNILVNFGRVQSICMVDKYMQHKSTKDNFNAI